MKPDKDKGKDEKPKKKVRNASSSFLRKAHLTKGSVKPRANPFNEMKPKYLRRFDEMWPSDCSLAWRRVKTDAGFGRRCNRRTCTACVTYAMREDIRAVLRVHEHWNLPRSLVTVSLMRCRSLNSMSRPSTRPRRGRSRPCRAS